MSPVMLETASQAPPKTKSQLLRSFRVADFPALTGREEEWRFTPLKRLRGLAGAEATVAAGTVKHDCTDLPAGFSMSTVDTSAVEPLLVPFDRISALAFEASSQVTLIEVDRGASPAAAALVKVVGGGADGLSVARTYVRVGAMADATLVLEHLGSTTLADNVEVSVGAGARLTLVTVANWESDAVQAQHVKFRLDRDAKITHVQVTLGGDLVRQYASVEYTGRGGDADLYGLYFATALPAEGAGARKGQHLEHRLLVDHAVPDCRSYVGYRGALQGDDSHTVWVGDVLIRAEATGTNTYEINRNLVLSDGARADSVPNLEIETGEIVGAGHASTTGRFDDEQLFYLMARGIPEPEARKLVVRGFFAELLAKIPVEELRERLAEVIESRLLRAGS